VLENLQQIMKNYYASQEKFSDGWNSGKVERENSETCLPAGRSEK